MAIENIDDFILNVGEYILELEKKKYISNNNLRDISLFFLLTDLFDDNDIEKIFLNYFNVLKENLEKYGIEEIGLISGNTFDLFVINEFKNKYGGMEKFYSNLEEVVYREAINKSIYLYKKGGVQSYDYDLIRGISGVLYYYLISNSKKDLSELVKYLVYLTEEKVYNAMNIMNFHIEFDPIEMEFEENGYINFSISHGMMAPLIALTLAKIKGYNVNGLDDGIYRILNMYEKFEKLKNDIYVWPTQLDAKLVFSGAWSFEEDPRIPECMSWCYGSMSISRGLSKVYKMLGNNKKSKEYKDKFLKLLYRDFENYYLHNPNLCHGYGSVITETLCMYKECNDKNLVKNIRELTDISMESYISVNNKLEEKIRTGKDIKIEDSDGTYKNFNFINGCIGYYLSLNAIINDKLEYSKLLLVDPYLG